MQWCYVFLAPTHRYVKNICRGAVNQSPLVSHRSTWYQFVSVISVCISSLSTPFTSLWIHIHTSCLAAAIQYIAIPCTIMVWVILDHTGFYWFLVIPVSSQHIIVQSYWLSVTSNEKKKKKIVSHQCTASYHIILPSWCIILHATSLYQLVFCSCLICIN